MASKAQKLASVLVVKNGENQYTLSEFVDVYSSTDEITGVVQNGPRKGLTYFVSKNGTKLWEAPSSFKNSFKNSLIEQSKCENWILNGKQFNPKEFFDGKNASEIVKNYCKVGKFFYSKNITIYEYEYTSKKCILYNRDYFREGEEILYFDVSTISGLKNATNVFLRSSSCMNLVTKKIDCNTESYNESKNYPFVSFKAPETPIVQKPQFVYSSKSGGACGGCTLQDPSVPSAQVNPTVNNTSRFISFGLNIVASIINKTQAQYYSQSPQYYSPQPIWNNPNPILGTGYVDNGGPKYGDGAVPLSGGPKYGDGAVPLSGGPSYGNSPTSNGTPTYGSGNNPVLGNGPRLFN